MYNNEPCDAEIYIVDNCQVIIIVSRGVGVKSAVKVPVNSILYRGVEL